MRFSARRVDLADVADARRTGDAPADARRATRSGRRPGGRAPAGRSSRRPSWSAPTTTRATSRHVAAGHPLLRYPASTLPRYPAGADRPRPGGTGPGDHRAEGDRRRGAGRVRGPRPTPRRAGARAVGGARGARRRCACVPAPDAARRPPRVRLPPARARAPSSRRDPVRRVPGDPRRGVRGDAAPRRLRAPARAAARRAVDGRGGRPAGVRRPGRGERRRLPPRPARSAGRSRDEEHGTDERMLELLAPFAGIARA